jgi:hypothetical protein
LHAFVDHSELEKDHGVEDEEAEHVLIVERIDDAGGLPSLEDLMDLYLPDNLLALNAQVNILDGPSGPNDTRGQLVEVQILLQRAHVLEELRDLYLISNLVGVLRSEVDSLLVDDETCVDRVNAEIALDYERHEDK